jgi:hypothetical protein
LLYPALLIIAYQKVPPSFCLFILIYPLFRLRSIWLSYDQTADQVDRACKLEYRLVTAWEYRSSPKTLVKPLLKEVFGLLEKTDLNQIFKLKAPRSLLLAIPALLVGIFSHMTLLSETPVPILEIPASKGQTVQQQPLQEEHEKDPDTQQDLVQMANMVQEVASGLQEGSMDEKAAINELNSVKEKLQKNLEKDGGFLEFTRKSELLVRFFNKLVKLDMAIAQIENKKLREIFDAMSISIPIQVYNPNAPYDSRFASHTSGGSAGGADSDIGGPGSGPSQSKYQSVARSTQSKNQIGELIDTQQTLGASEAKPMSGKIADKRSPTGAPVDFFSLRHLPKTYQHLVRSYFGSPEPAKPRSDQ